MDITYKDTPNGEVACSCNNVRLHSFYNPSKEAERFVLSAECQFNPSYILITEPAISYAVPYLKIRFPKAKICCIRFCNDFDNWNKSFDKIFYAQDNGCKNQNLSEEIFNYMGDEGTAACLFLAWKASDQAFPDISKFAWDEIKKSVIKSRSILGTRDFFAKRWAKNALRFALFTGKTASIKKGTSDILICASGPSLYGSMEYIKEFRDRFFLIAVSSALSPLIKNGIIPDLCISTDGGFYAKRHISFALKKNRIPLSLPGEGSCFGTIMNEVSIVPLLYGDGISEDILKESGFSGLKAVRNGSVSGTALYLAMNITEGNIYYCGLDLAFSKGFVHTQPNELEICDGRFDGRLRTTETRISASILNKGSIDIYRSWFSSTDFNGRAFRLSRNFNYGNNLGDIRDVNWDFFKENTKNFSSRKKPEIIELKTEKSDNVSVEKLKKICSKNSGSSQWIHNAVPSEAVVMDRTTGTKFHDDSKRKVEKGMKEFLADITRAIEK
ncbi:6-hydroxymethylpterin diphosphokinase MptE-like protein [Treponema sp.]|uniref:6-hydroxymethylpterin diphosphokinase MptE-like protein n=1 Tax=Treponema sp. TaxID=166 RepID=UPI00298D8B95|nr:6-hydroxymethylpterin diphosphokinase MptE-like protein [Treponema sp.]MCQ2240605.1 DUF115 domain-containing protein [Treponema sp.]